MGGILPRHTKPSESELIAPPPAVNTRTARRQRAPRTPGAGVPRRVATVGCIGRRPRTPAVPGGFPRAVAWRIAPSRAPHRRPCASTVPGSLPLIGTRACPTRAAIPVAARSWQGLTRRGAGRAAAKSPPRTGGRPIWPQFSPSGTAPSRVCALPRCSSLMSDALLQVSEASVTGMAHVARFWPMAPAP